MVACKPILLGIFGKKGSDCIVFKKIQTIENGMFSELFCI